MDGVPFHKLTYAERNARTSQTQTYSQTVYKKTKRRGGRSRNGCVSEREFVLRQHGSRSRYDYKGLKKKWSREAKEAKRAKNVVKAEEARNKTPGDSLSSFEVYSELLLRIRDEKRCKMVQHGDGWCCDKDRCKSDQTSSYSGQGIGRLWSSIRTVFGVFFQDPFENFTFKLKNGKKINISYPCVMLNVDVHKNYTNHQYQVLKKGRILENLSTRLEVSARFSSRWTDRTSVWYFPHLPRRVSF